MILFSISAKLISKPARRKMLALFAPISFSYRASILFQAVNNSWAAARLIADATIRTNFSRSLPVNRENSFAIASARFSGVTGQVNSYRAGAEQANPCLQGRKRAARESHQKTRTAPHGALP